MEETIKITSIRIKKFGKPRANVLGIVSITLNDQIVIHDIKIVQLRDKRILSFPAKKVSRVESKETSVKHYYSYEDVVHPLNNNFRKYLEEVIFTQFDNTEEFVNE